MNPAQINFNVDELTRMTMQVREHNHSDDQNNVTLCLCQECHIVRAFRATTPILDQLQRAKAATEARNGLGDFLRRLFAELADDEDDEPAEDAPRDTYAGIDAEAPAETPADDTYQRDAEGHTATETPAEDTAMLDGVWCSWCNKYHPPTPADVD